MRYWKRIADGILVAIGTGEGDTEITETEYNELLALIQSIPTAPEGYVYRVNADGEYVLVEVEPMPEPSDDDELTADEAFDIIMGVTL